MLTTKQLAGEVDREPPGAGDYGVEEKYDEELRWREADGRAENEEDGSEGDSDGQAV